MKKDIFEKEIAMCQKLSKDNGGHCHWGECEKCGVIPLLYKLFKDKVYENKDEIKKIKQVVLSLPVKKLLNRKS